MSYILKNTETPGYTLRRVITEQLNSMLTEIDDTELEIEEKIHQVRKRCKKIRSILRLFREPLGNIYKTENTFYRDAARWLSDIRDATAMKETYDDIAEHHKSRIDLRKIVAIRRKLEKHEKEILADSHRIDMLLNKFAAAMISAKKRSENLELTSEAYTEIIPGFINIYQSAEKEMIKAKSSRNPGDFHNWRKRVKYHWYHSRLLQNVWPEMMKARAKELDSLGDKLGNHHNVYVLKNFINENHNFFGDIPAVKTFFQLSDQWMKELEKESLITGYLLFAERPKDLKKRFSKYLELWEK